MSGTDSTLQGVVTLILGGGIGASIKQALDWLRHRGSDRADVARTQAERDSVIAKAAETVVEMLRTQLTAQDTDIRRLRLHVARLEAALRTAGIPIPMDEGA